METIKKNKLYLFGAAAIGLYFYSTQMTQEEFKAAIAKKEQELPLARGRPREGVKLPFPVLTSKDALQGVKCGPPPPL